MALRLRLANPASAHCLSAASLRMIGCGESRAIAASFSVYAHTPTHLDRQLVVVGQSGAYGSVMPMNCCHSAAVRFLAAI